MKPSTNWRHQNTSPFLNICCAQQLKVVKDSKDLKTKVIKLIHICFWKNFKDKSSKERNYCEEIKQLLFKVKVFVPKNLKLSLRRAWLAVNQEPKLLCAMGFRSSSSAPSKKHQRSSMTSSRTVFLALIYSPLLLT